MELYEDIEEDESIKDIKTAHDAIMAKLRVEQQKLHDSIIAKGADAVLDDDYEVVSMPKCLGTHGFHRACLE